MSFAWLTPLREILGRFKLSQYLLVLCFVWASAASLGWKLQDLRADKAEAETQAQIQGRAADANLYRAAQAEYTAKALAEKAEQERIDRERKEEADEAYTTLLGQYRAALSLRRYTPAGSPSGGNDLPSAPASPGSVDTGAANTIIPPTDYLLISWEDADICAENTAKVVTIYEWYQNR